MLKLCILLHFTENSGNRLSFRQQSHLCINKHHTTKTSKLRSLTSTLSYTNPLQKLLILMGLREFKSFVFITVSCKFYPFPLKRLKSELVTTE
jgi:hypothetical protein